MTEYDPEIARILNQALPYEFGAADWELVLTESRSSPARRFPRRNHGKLVLLVALAFVAVLVPLSALGIANDWWFFSVRGNPLAPTGSVITIASGRVEGAPWELIAFMTKANGLCFSVTLYPPSGNPSSAAGPALPSQGIVDASQGMAGCGGVRGLAGATWQPLVNSVEGSVTTRSGAIALVIGGPTDSSVAEVDVVESDGETVTTQSFPAPSELGLPIRFFVAALPPSTHVGVKELIARDAAGNVLRRIPFPTH